MIHFEEDTVFFLEVNMIPGILPAGIVPQQERAHAGDWRNFLPC